MKAGGGAAERLLIGFLLVCFGLVAAFQIFALFVATLSRAHGNLGEELEFWRELFQIC